MKDVTHSTLTEIPVQFTPAVIKVDRDWVKSQLDAIVAQYKGYEVTASTYKADYDERTRLNKLKQALETRRKEINSEISQPYKDFKKWYDETVKPLDEVINHITEGLNAIDEHERILRLDVVRVAFESRCGDADIDKDHFADKYDEYSLKKYFKIGKFELKKSTLDEFDALVLKEFDRVAEYKANQQAVCDTAVEYGLLEDGYIRHLEDGKSLVDVLKLMKSDRDAMVARKEQQEAQAKAEAERLAEIERIAKENANSSIKAIDADTGEIIEDYPPELESGGRGGFVHQTTQTTAERLKIEPSEPLTVTMLLTLHGGKPQLDSLKEYLEDNFISFETLGGI